MLASARRALNCSSILLAVAKYLMNLLMGVWREHGTNHRFTSTEWWIKTMFCFSQIFAEYIMQKTQMVQSESAHICDNVTFNHNKTICSALISSQFFRLPFGTVALLKEWQLQTASLDSMKLKTFAERKKKTTAAWGINI